MLLSLSFCIAHSYLAAPSKTETELLEENTRLRTELRRLREQLEMANCLTRAMTNDNRGKDATIAFLVHELGQLKKRLHAEAGLQSQPDH